LKCFPTTHGPLIRSPRKPKISFQYLPPPPRLSPIEKYTVGEMNKDVKENDDDIEKMLERIFAKHDVNKQKGLDEETLLPLFDLDLKETDNLKAKLSQLSLNLVPFQQNGKKHNQEFVELLPGKNF